jgi:hypothetical protein
MGGIPDSFAFLSNLSMAFDGYLVIPGAEGKTSTHRKLILLPRHSSFYHPDLMLAADALIGKAGYSTVAEAYLNDIPFGYIKRPGYPESRVLENYIQQNMLSLPIPMHAYNTGTWVRYIPDLLNLSHQRQNVENGADKVARLLCRLHLKEFKTHCELT